MGFWTGLDNEFGWLKRIILFDVLSHRIEIVIYIRRQTFDEWLKMTCTDEERADFDAANEANG